MRLHRLILVLLSVALVVPISASMSAAADTGTLTEIARLGRGWIGSLSWTEDGDAILAASLSGVWRYGLDGSEQQLLPPSGTQIGSQYVMDMADGQLTITALATGVPLAFQPEWAGYTLAAFSPDQIHLALADSATIEVWLLPHGEHKASIPIDATPSSETLTFSADNRLVAAAFTVRRENVQPGEPFDREEIRVWDAATGEQVATLTTDGLDFLVTSVAFSVDSRTLITSRVGGVTVYDIASSDYRRLNLAEVPLGGDSRELRVVHGVVFSYAESRIVASWFDISSAEHMSAHITVWDAQTGEIVNELGGLAGYVRGLTTSPDDNQIALYTYEGTLLVWDLVGEAYVLTNQHPAAADVLAIHGNMLAVGGFDNAVRLWSLAERKLHTTLFNHSTEVQAIAFGQDGLLASASRYHTWTWNLDTGVQDVDVVAADALTLGFDGDTLRGVVSSPGGASFLWEASAQGVESTELGINGDVAAIAGQRVAINTPENLVLFDVTGEERARLLPQAAVTDLSFSPDAALLLVGEDNNVSLWNVEADPELLWAVETDSPASALAFSPDGSRIALGTANGVLEVRRVEDGALLDTAHAAGALSDVIFGPDGQSVITAIDTQIVIWSAD